MVSDPAAQDDFGRVVDGAQVQQVRTLSAALGDRERGIVLAHYGLGPPAKTLREIAVGLELSVERVRQIEQQALTKLRDALEQPSPEPDEPERRSELRELPADEQPPVLRGSLSAALAREHASPAEATDMLIATHEVAACMWEDGGSPERVRVGRISDSLVCEIFTRGAGFKRTNRLGLWMARRLTTRIEDRASAEGHTVRLWI
jgi:hypothetical protein